MNNYNKSMCNLKNKSSCNCCLCKSCNNNCCKLQNNILNSLFCVEKFLCCTQNAHTICKLIDFFK